MANITGLYAAYKAGFLGNNILDTYFSFIATIILNDKMTVVEDSVIAKKFYERYSIELPLPFVRQVLGIGVGNGSFVEDHGKYCVSIDELPKYCFKESDFSIMWKELLDAFAEYCLNDGVDLSSIELESFVLDILDKTDEQILVGDQLENSNGISAAEFAWYSFTKEQGETNTKLFSFIAALSASNITKQAIFYAGETAYDYSGLHVYLDSPIVFALLGMDEKSRTDSYKSLVSDMISSNCHVHVFDSNFEEVDGIISRAAGWATDANYDLRRANNAARFFHDSHMSESEISEFCDSIETKLNELGITIKETSYDIYQDKFQEDETCLVDMIKSKYSEQGHELSSEREESIQIDVRSIVMVYRERQGQTATRLEKARHIMLTSNNAIANVSKKFESNRSINSGHIPACISADLFGTILWLNKPIKLLEYNKQKLLADCYAFLTPNKKLLDKYIQSLDDARKADEIDEKRYLFLRTHTVVLESLMNITKGDYARYDSHTYLEVYEDIQEKALKQYKDEAAAHERTRDELNRTKEDFAEEKKKDDKEKDILKKENERIKKQEKKRIDRNTKIIGWVLTILLVGCPYIALMIIIDLIKTRYSDFSWHSAFGFGGTAIATVVAGVLFAFGKKACFKLAHFIIIKCEESEGY